MDDFSRLPQDTLAPRRGPGAFRADAEPSKGRPGDTPRLPCGDHCQFQRESMAFLVTNPWAGQGMNSSDIWSLYLEEIQIRGHDKRENVGMWQHCYFKVMSHADEIVGKKPPSYGNYFGVKYQ